MPIAVTEQDIDGRSHVNNLVYLRWAIDAAKAHWNAIAPVDVRAGLAFVALRHEIDYLKPAFLGDELEARTWIEGSGGPRFQRRVEIVRASDGAVVARSLTTWCAVDAESGRPRRVPEHVHDLFAGG